MLLKKKFFYLPNFNDSGFMTKEIIQDILYVMLNIILGKSILENGNLNTNNKVNLSVLIKIISHHYNTYDKAYK